MRNNRFWIVVAAGLALGGCNMGMAPSGGDSAQVIDNFNHEDPQQQIRTIQMSPASAEKKAQLIHDIEVKYHITAGATPVGGQAPAAASGAGK